MGFAFTQAAFNTDKARGLNKLVLWVICEHANEKNKDEAWPSIPTIAAEAGVCENTVMKATRFLESAGLIQVVRTKVTTKDGKPQNLVNRYRPIISAMTEEGGGAPDAVPPTPCNAIPYSTPCTTPTPPDALPPSAPDAPPYCTTCTVTNNEPVMVEPVTVNPVSQKGQERKEESEQVAEASPPSSGESESEEFKEWSESALRLVRKLNPVQDETTVSCEGAFAQMSVDYLEGASVDPCDLVDYNWTHKAPKFPKLRISSCQWLWERVLKQGTNLRLVNEYVGHESDGCKECRAGRPVSWTKMQEAKRKAARIAAWHELENQDWKNLLNTSSAPHHGGNATVQSLTPRGLA